MAQTVATIGCGLVIDSIACLSPWPILYKLDFMQKNNSLTINSDFRNIHSHLIILIST